MSDYSRIKNEKHRNSLIFRKAIEQWLVLGFFVLVLGMFLFFEVLK